MTDPDPTNADSDARSSLTDEEIVVEDLESEDEVTGGAGDFDADGRADLISP